MASIRDKLIRFLASEEGPTAVEYAVLFLLALLGILTIITAIGRATAGGTVPY